MGSTYEIIAASFLALDRGYIDEEERRALYAEGERLVKSINAFRRSLVTPKRPSHEL